MRDTQSMAFLSNGGSEALYSGVDDENPVMRSDHLLEADGAGGHTGFCLQIAS